MEDAIEYAGDAKRLLRTDLWLECLGMNDLVRGVEGLDYLGIDISAEICAGAKSIIPDIAQASIVKIPFKSNTFDVIIDISTIDHISHPQIPSVIEEYARLLKPKGVLLLCTDSKLSLPWEVYRRIVLKYSAYSWMPKQLRSVVSANHFDILEEFFGNTFLDSLFWPLLQHSDSRFYAIFSTIAQYYVIFARKTAAKPEHEVRRVDRPLEAA
jgi:SAM-dependent methyltransferase